MPKLKVSQQKQNEKMLSVNIKYLMETKGITKEDLAIAAGIGKSTLYKRLLEPGKFTYRELQHIARKLQVSIAILICAKLEEGERI